MKIYVPDLSYECYVVRDTNTIRAYEQTPTNGVEISYRDYYINSNYLYQDGSQNFGNYATIPICLDENILSNEVYYRNDFDSIMIIFLILSIFCFYLPIKIIFRLFRRFQ